MTRVNEMFLCVISHYLNEDLFHYLAIRDCKNLPKYSTEKAIEIYFNLIRDFVTGKYGWCINPTPKEARELAIMFEEWYRWEIVN